MNQISNMIDRLKEYNVQHEKLMSWLVFPIVVGLILKIFPTVCSNVRKYFGKIDITKESFINWF